MKKNKGIDYDIISKSYDNLYREEQESKIKIILRKWRIKQEERLLDVGCGTGISMEPFKCKKIGIDPSKNMVKIAIKKGLKCFVANAENMPFKSNYFDRVIAITSIHNFNDIEKGLKEIKRVGRKYFAFSILKKSKKYNYIIKKIKEMFKVKQEIDEEKDKIFLCEK